MSRRRTARRSIERGGQPASLHPGIGARNRAARRKGIIEGKHGIGEALAEQGQAALDQLARGAEVEGAKPGSSWT